MALTQQQLQEEKKKVEQYRSQGMTNEEIAQQYKSDPEFVKKAQGTKLKDGKVVQSQDQNSAMLPGNDENQHTQQVKPSNQVTRDDEGIDTPREQLSVAERQAKMNDGRQMKGSTQWRAKFSPHTQSTYERILGRGGNREPKPMPMKDLSGLSAREIVDQYASGDIRDDEIKGLLESDPLKYEEVKNKKQQMSLYRQMNEEKSDYQARRNKIHSQYRDRVKDNYSFNSAERFDEKIKNNPKIQETKERIAKSERQLNDLYATRDNLYDNVVLSGNYGANVAMGQYSVALQKLNNQIGAMENTVELEQSLYNDYIDLERQSLAYELDDKKQEMAYEFDMYGLEKDMNYEDYEMGVQSIAMDLERLEKERAEIKEDQKIEQAKELMEQEQQSDKAFARFSVSQYFEGLPADQKANMLDMKPDQIMDVLSYQMKLEDMRQIKVSSFEGSAGERVFVDQNGNVVNTYITPTTLAQKAQNLKEGGKDRQCGAFVNEVLGLGWRGENGKGMPDSFEGKKALINSTVPVVGSAFVMNTGTQYGHTGIVKSINNDGTITIIDANSKGGPDGSGDGKIRERTIKTDSIVGYYVPEGVDLSEDQEKTSILAMVRSGSATDSQMEKYREKSIKEGWVADFNDALNNKYDSSAIQDLQKTITTSETYKNMADIRRGYENINGIYSDLDNATGFEDISAINSLQRMIDPGATVREGDVALIESAVPYFERIAPGYKREKLKKGSVLPPNIREKLVETAKSIYDNQSTSYNNEITRLYQDTAMSAGRSLEEIGVLMESDNEIQSNGASLDVYSSFAQKEGIKKASSYIQ